MYLGYGVWVPNGAHPRWAWSDCPPSGRHLGPAWSLFQSGLVSSGSKLPLHRSDLYSMTCIYNYAYICACIKLHVTTVLGER